MAKDDTIKVLPEQEKIPPTGLMMGDSDIADKSKKELVELIVGLVAQQRQEAENYKVRLEALADLIKVISK